MTGNYQSGAEVIPITSSAQQDELGEAVRRHVAARTGGTMSDKQVFVRAFPTAITQTVTAKGRTLTGRLVPYNEVADVLDDLPTGPDIYKEGFCRGAFDVQAKAHEANGFRKNVLTKIGLVHRHEGGLGYLGPATALRDEPDGLWGDFMVLPTKADDVEALLEAGVNELSIEFRLRSDGTHTDDSGVRWRTAVHLDGVALEPKGAYSSAQVLAYRNEQDEIDRQARDEERKQAEEAAAREAAAAEAVERKRQWDELAARVDPAREQQHQLVKEYGVTRTPPSWDRK